ncbi:uncharacterized protein FIBRA_00064 [Fibroporia radiculosa]|uniref:Cytochrome P450 n=1 Tax=Fibroporia radiculosa TaxID=599839 RepID=J7RUS4_9APHY|nr:uncharacterized protein FIBRA_00064 [Fibroporia radiculosa]CCL98070.1 predicted protein [Fibroporia radiculosa]
MVGVLQVIGAVSVVVCIALLMRWRFDPLYHIPAIGPSSPLLSYLGAYRYCRNAKDMLQEGYNKYKVFRVPYIDRWIVIVSGPDMNEELRRFPDSHVSFEVAASEIIQTKYTIAPNLHRHPIHLPVIRGPLTRNLNVVFAGVIDEIQKAFVDVIPINEDEWTKVHAIKVMAQDFRQFDLDETSLLEGRDPEYLDTVVNFTFNVTRGRFILSFVPSLFKSAVGHMLPWSKRAIRRASVFLKPLIEERKKKLRQLGDDWSDKPNDLLMWLMDEARKVGEDDDLVVQSVLMSNFAAIHTSSHSITHALYHLAANPEYVQPLREEAEFIIKEHGWTKAAMGKMRKLDSFMRESQRLNGITSLTVMRQVLQSITLSDGTYIPAGTIISASARSTHDDKQLYDRADEFDPFRFSDMREGDSEGLKHQYVTTSPEYVAFGHGKHACPGRFFAVNELKVMMVYMLLNFDIKFEHEGGRPENLNIWHSVLPAPNVNLMFRKRRDVLT